MAIRQNITDLENDPVKVGTQYTTKTPHPGYDIDPNIINVFGHTHYPKWIDHPWKKQVHRTTTYIGRDQSTSNVLQTNFPEQVWVADEAEEKKVLAEKDPNAKPEEIVKADHSIPEWPKKKQGN